MTTMLEWFKGVGVLSGIISLCIILYDKWVSGRPIVFPTPSNNPIGSRSLVIFNPSDSDIIVRSIQISPEIYSVMKSDSVRDGLMSAYGIPWMALVRSKASAEFPLAAKDVLKEERDQDVRISVRWYNTSSPWWPYRPVVVKTSTARLRELVDAAMQASKVRP